MHRCYMVHMCDEENVHGYSAAGDLLGAGRLGSDEIESPGEREHASGMGARGVEE